MLESVRVMHLLRVVAVAAASIVGTALWTIERAAAEDPASCSNASLPETNATGDDEDNVGFAGAGSGGDARGVLPPTPALKTCGEGVTGAIKPSAAVAWFNALAPADRHKFMREAAKVGVVDRDGNAFDVTHFDEMAEYFDEAMTRQGMSDAAKLKLLRTMATDAGIAADNKAETHDVHGS